MILAPNIGSAEQRKSFDAQHLDTPMGRRDRCRCASGPGGHRTRATAEWPHGRRCRGDAAGGRPSAAAAPYTRSTLEPRLRLSDLFTGLVFLIGGPQEASPRRFLSARKTCRGRPLPRRLPVYKAAIPLFAPAFIVFCRFWSIAYTGMMISTANVS